MKVFYQKNAVHAVLQSDGNVTLLRAQGAPMAEHVSASAHFQGLVFGCDQQGSPMTVMSAKNSCTGSYTPYGFETTLQSVTGFTGQPKAWNLPGYFLGNGYRFFNTVLMRFNSPDSLSPFAAGGINAYMYCEGDPVNQSDPSGHNGLRGSTGNFWKRLNTGNSKTIPMGSTFSLERVFPQGSERLSDKVPTGSWRSTYSSDFAPPVHASNTASTRKRRFSGSSSGVIEPGDQSPAKRVHLASGNSSDVVSPISNPLAMRELLGEFVAWNKSVADPIGGLSLIESQRARAAAFIASQLGVTMWQAIGTVIPKVHVHVAGNVINSVRGWLQNRERARVRTGNVQQS